MLHMTLIKDLVEGQYGMGLLINALLYIPQAVRIFQQKASDELSLIMFVGFWLLTLSQVIYGFYIGNHLIAWGTSATLITSGLVLCLIIAYRRQ